MSLDKFSRFLNMKPSNNARTLDLCLASRLSIRLIQRLLDIFNGPFPVHKLYTKPNHSYFVKSTVVNETFIRCTLDLTFSRLQWEFGTNSDP